MRRDAEDLAAGQQAPSTSIQAPEKHQILNKKAVQPAEVLNHKGTENTKVSGQEKLSTTSPRPSPPIRLAERETGAAGSRKRTVKAANEGEQKFKTNWGLESPQNRQVGKPARQPKTAQPAKAVKVVEPEKGWWMLRGMNRTWVPGKKPDNFDENGIEIQSNPIRKAVEQDDQTSSLFHIQQQARLGNHKNTIPAWPV